MGLRGANCPRGPDEIRRNNYTMKQSMKTILCIALGLMLALAMAACSAPATPAATEAPAASEAPAATEIPEATEAPVPEATDVPAAVTYTPGTYTAAAASSIGDLKVDVTVSESSIDSIIVTDSNGATDTVPAVIADLTADILDSQSLKADASADTTGDAAAVLAAVEDCLTQAGADVSLLK